MANDYSKLSKEDLLKFIEKIKSRKKYGLVWDEERTKEQFEKKSENALPVLKEVKSKEIKTDPSKPVNILIEGDNYHSLSVLNYTHQKKIDIIYIDPPYNTGGAKEWKFNDKWIDKHDSYRHSKWLSFISKRLRLAKYLLADHGLIMISIDDNEYAQLKLLCDDVFGENQFVTSLVWEKKKKGSHLDKFSTNIKEYILVYCKNESYFKGLIGEITYKKETYPCLNPGNGYSKRIIPKNTISNYRDKDYILKKGETISAGNMKLILQSNLVIKNGRIAQDVEIEAEWRYDQKALNEYAQKDELYLTRDLYLRRIVTEPREKKLKDILPRIESSYLSDLKSELIEEYEKSNVDLEKIEELKKKIDEIESVSTLDEKDFDNLYKDGWGSNEDGDNELRDFFGEKVFNYPKPKKLIQKLLLTARIKKGFVLDFFAGTGTTAEAVMRLNQKGYNLTYILCTDDEDNNDTGLRIATDICYPRIKSVIKGYKNRNSQQVSPLGGNLKYFKTSFVKRTINKDSLKIRITQECTEMLCLREGIFGEIKKTDNYRIFRHNGKIMAVYCSLEQAELKYLKKDLDKMKGEKILYCFTLDPLGLDKNDFLDWEDVSLEPIPQKILDIYEGIYEY
jgi:adenine-specific DNA-methyltransferase